MPEPYYADDAVTIFHGDVLDVLDEGVGEFDAVIADPPSGGSDPARLHAARRRTPIRPHRLGGRSVKVRPIFAWYDLWVGVFVDRAKRKVYVFPLPCIGLVVSW